MIAFDHAFHGRTNLTMALTAKVVPYKDGFGPLAPEVYRSPLDLDALRVLLQAGRAAGARRVRRARAGAGRGRLHPDAGRVPARVAGALRRARDPLRRRRGPVRRRPHRPVWAIEHYGVEPDLLVSGKSLGGGLPLAGVTGKSELMDAVPPGGLGGTFGGNPLACAAAIAVLNEVRTEEFRARAEELGGRIRTRLEALDAGEVRGIGPMLAIEFPEKSPELASRVTAAARERGLVLLSCGMYGNVIRILVPLSIDDALLERGLDLLEESLGDAGAA